MPNAPNPEWIFYHALYHLVYHWAAYVAFLVLLITIGVVVSVSAVPRSRLYIGFAIIVSCLASGFFLWRMHTFGKIVNENLAGAATATMWTSDPMNLWIGAAVTACVVIADLIILCKK